jgi:hypothetical protein
MVKNAEELQAFEDELARSEHPTLEQKFRILDAMYEQAVLLGALPEKDPLTGIDDCIRLAKALNSVP